MVTESYLVAAAAAELVLGGVALHARHRALLLTVAALLRLHHDHLWLVAFDLPDPAPGHRTRDFRAGGISILSLH